MENTPLSVTKIKEIIDDPNFFLGDDDSFYDSDSDLDNRLDNSDGDLECNSGNNCDTNQSETPVWEKISDVFSGNTIKLDSVPNFNGQRVVKDFQGLEPVECFYKFFPQNIFEHVAEQTNLYFNQCVDKTFEFPPHSRVHKWKEINSLDIKVFVAAEIGMGLCNKSELFSYFENKFWLTQTPGFRQLFTKNKYFLMKSFLHFNDNINQIPKGNNGYDQLYKIRPIIDMTKNTYLEYFEPGEALSVDETMIKFKGRLSFKQYLPSKPSSKWGIKVWSLCDSGTGFLCRFVVYTGKDKERGYKEEGLASRIVKTLLEGLENRGHVVYLDNFYSSVNLFTDLQGIGFGACGTVRVNRKGLPQDMKVIKKKKGDLPDIWIDKQSKILACSWQDTGKVNMISTVGNAGVAEVHVRSKQGPRNIHKPNVQVLYNKNMGGVDRFDQYCSTYPYSRRSRKWYQTIWHFIIEVALVNGCIAYNIQNPSSTCSHREFRERVIDGLVCGYKKLSTHKRKGRRISIASNERLVGRHFPTQFTDKSHKPNCVVCSIMPSSCKKKGKGACKRKQTTFYCSDCSENPALCVTPCFRTYHTQTNYKSTCQCEI